MSPEEAAEVTDRPMTFLSVPFGFGPPAPHPTGLIQAELQPPQQGQGHHLHLEGAQHGLLSPRPAFFHAETLLMVTEAIFLAKTGRKRLHDLGGRQIQGRRHQEPELSVPRHRDDEDMHGNFRATDRPPAPQMFVPEQASPAIAPSPAGSPKGGPVYMVLRGRKPLTPLRPTTLRLGSGHHWVVQPGIHSQPRQNLYSPSPRTRVQARFDYRRHGVGPIKHAQDRRTRLRIRLTQPLHGPGRFGLNGLAR